MILSELAESLYSLYRLSEDNSIIEEGVFLIAYQTAQHAGSEDMTGGILFLTCHAGTFMNGSILMIDGKKPVTVPSTYWLYSALQVRVWWKGGGDDQ